tara:strand:+ start:2488 stop:3264 length:777 start_codon:yes stop_codon:yes gene_type:complete
MSETKSNTVAKKEESLPVAIFEQDAGGGLSGLTQDDLATPRLKVLMNGSKELEENENLKPGQIFNTVTNEAYDGKEGIVVIPCEYQRQFVEWEERGTGSGAPVNIFDANSDILQKTKRSAKNKDELENGNYIETNANHFVLLIDPKTKAATPALVTMKSTQLKKSRKWNSMMLQLRIQGSKGAFNPPRYSHTYKLTVSKEKNDQGSWYGWNVELIGPVSDQDTYNTAKEFAESVNSGSVQAKPEMESDSADSGTKTPF